MTVLETQRETRLFGTDGVRGCANAFPMTVETALALGRAVGMVFRRGSARHRVVIGKDTRLSGYMFENALVAGLCSMGVDTLIVGPLPTPGVAYITRAYRADAGIVISASHNPYYDNGIKFFSPAGFKLPESIEREIEEVVASAKYEEILPHDDQLGKNTRIEDAQGRYIEFCKSAFPRQLSLRGMKIAIDCANGAAYRVAPLVFEELEASVITTAAAPNGLNINEHCGATYPQAIAKVVQEKQVDVGIAFDGDGDRVIMVDEKGNVVDGDVMMAICAKQMQLDGELDGSRVVGTVMTNFGVVRSLEKIGIEVVSARVGDRHVLHQMLEKGAVLGGEQSGHMIFLRYNTTGDGIVAALQILRIMQETGKPLSELASWVERYPQRLINIEVDHKPPLTEVEKVQKAIVDCERTFGTKGRVIVRYSGTSNIWRVMAEGADESLVTSCAEDLAEIIRGEIG